MRLAFIAPLLALAACAADLAPPQPSASASGPAPADERFDVRLTATELDIIAGALAEGRFRDVAPVINDLKTQYDAAQAAKSEKKN